MQQVDSNETDGAACDQHGAVLRQYAGRGAEYLHSSVHARGQDLEDMAYYLGVHRVIKLLDVGTGAGHAAFHMAPLAGVVVASDLSADMLATVAQEATRRNLNNIVTQQVAAEGLGFADATFDAVMTRFSAHHWQDMAAGVREMHRVLQPGGLALFADLVSPGNYLLDTWLQSIELLRDPSHVRSATLAEWQGVLAQSGFQIEAVKTYRLRNAFAAWFERMRTPASHVGAIRSLLGLATREVMEYFAIDKDEGFTVDNALIVARRL